MLGIYPTPLAAAEISPKYVDFSTSTAPLVLAAFASKYHIDPGGFIETARCESRFDKNAVGDKGTSFGVWQIHAPAHLDITKAQMLDPWWSTEWAAQQFAKGNQLIWSCYNKLFGGNSPPQLVLKE